MPASEGKKARRKANRQKKRNLKKELVNRIKTGNTTHNSTDTNITFEIPSGELFRGEFSSSGKTRGIITCGNNINKSLYLEKSFKAYAREVINGKNSILEGELRESALKLLEEPKLTRKGLNNFSDFFKEELEDAYNRHLEWIQDLKPNKTVKKYYPKAS